MNLRKSGLVVTIANVAKRVLQLLGIIYFSNVIGAEQLGIFILSQAIIGILSLPADMGIRGSIEKRISEGHQTAEIIGSSLLLKTPLVLFVIAGQLLFVENLNAYVGTDIASLLVIGLFVQEAAGVVIHALNGNFRVAEASILQLSQTIVWVIVGVYLVRIGYGGKGLVMASVCGFLFLLGVGIFILNASVPFATWEGVQSVYSFAKFNSITDIGWKVYSWVDVLIIGYFLSQEFVSAYEVSWRAGSAVVLISLSISSVIFPRISSLHANGKYNEIEGILKRSLVPSLSLVLPAFFGTIILGDEILTIIFGQEFGVAYGAFIILILQRVFQAIHMVLGRSVQAMDEIEFAAKFKLIGVTANIVLNLLLTPTFGLVGAAIATTLSYGLNTTAHVSYLSRLISIKVPKLEVCWCLFSSIVMFGFLALYTHIVEVNNAASLIAALAVAVGVYFTVFLSNGKLRMNVISYLPNRLVAIIP